jgi:transforming growth factor-beta-induced protein
MRAIIRISSVFTLLAAVAVTPALAWRGFGLFGNFPPRTARETASETIVDLAVATPELSTLVQAVLKADLAEMLDRDGDFTVFAPTNDAFAAAGIDPASVDVETLTAVLLDHVAPGNFNTGFLRAQARSAERLSTLGGLTLGFDESPLAVNGRNVLIRDIRAANGTVFVIDGVLTRPAPSIVDRALGAEALSTLVEAVSRAGLVEVLDETGPYTVFVPTNQAFARAGIDPAVVDEETLGAVLKDHVVPGEFTFQEISALRLSGGTLTTLGGLDLGFRLFPFRVNGVRVVSSNISAGNGIVYLIDGVLLEQGD